MYAKNNIGRRCRVFGQRAKEQSCGGYKPELWDTGVIVEEFNAGFIPFFLLSGGREVTGFRVRLDTGKIVTAGFLNIKIDPLTHTEMEA